MLKPGISWHECTQINLPGLKTKISRPGNANLSSGASEGMSRGAVNGWANSTGSLAAWILTLHSFLDCPIPKVTSSPTSPSPVVSHHMFERTKHRCIVSCSLSTRSCCCSAFNASGESGLYSLECGMQCGELDISSHDDCRRGAPGSM